MSAFGRASIRPLPRLLGVLSSRTDPDDDVVDVMSFSALDVVETRLLVVVLGAEKEEENRRRGEVEEERA